MLSFKQITIRKELNHHKAHAQPKVATGQAARQRKFSRPVWYALARKLKQRLSPGQKDEISSLNRYAWLAVCGLLLLLISAIGYIVFSLAGLVTGTQSAPFLLAKLSVAAGLAGSTVSALYSVADRYAHGWELEDGTKVPRGITKPDRFVQRMIPWFLIRPFLGAAMGLAIYIALFAGFFGGTGRFSGEETSSSGFRLIFSALLVGLFAKKFLDSLRRAFAAFVGDEASK